ncbi:hypothetical protein ACS0TY_014348 [Phlomoides rotata]
MLKKLDGGEQPSTVIFYKALSWLQIYDLPLTARSENIVKLIASKCGEVVEIDLELLKRLARSIRVKVKVEVWKPMNQGLNLELKNSLRNIWVSFKYERLPSFCYFYGMLGHMKRKCDLVEGEDTVADIHDEKLPFGEWMRNSHKTPKQDTSLHRKLFERFKKIVKSV